MYAVVGATLQTFVLFALVNTVHMGAAYSTAVFANLVDAHPGPTLGA